MRAAGVRLEAVRELYAHGDEATAREWIERLIADMAEGDNPLEVRSLSRTLARWKEQIVAWHRSHVSNGPTEAAILWSGQRGVSHVADKCVSVCRRHVLWSLSLTSTTSSVP
jgi:hypothetical protein